jgi:hypothetical protein
MKLRWTGAAISTCLMLVACGSTKSDGKAATPSTKLPKLTITGTVAFLDQVGFDGKIDGMDWRPDSRDPCSGTGGYEDLSAGGSVAIAGGTGATLAVVPLQSGHIVKEIRKTQSERDKRESVIDSIYEFRVTTQTGGDPLATAKLNLDRATQRLKDISNPGGAFEGHAFVAAWCHLAFASPPLPLNPTYSVTVTHRGATTYTAQQIRDAGGRVTLTIGD